MKMQLLEIGSETEQLSACRISLLLGVFTSENRVEGFLKFARGILQAERGILTFHHEPYIWYSAPESFKAFHAQKEASLVSFFEGDTILSTKHKNYAAFSQHVHDLGVGHNRIVGFDLKINKTESIGQVLLFDEQTESFNEENLQLVHEFAMSLINIIELRSNYAELKELYEQQSALNFSKTKFFQIIAHDLRAPFHGLIGFSEVLAQERETLDDSSIQSIADYLLDTSQSTYNLLESLLNWAMAEGGRFVYHPINFNLKQSSKIVFDVLNSLAIKKNIQLIDQVPDDIKVYADINMVTSVLQNLVSNALKFTHVDGTGKVTIHAEQSAQYVDIYIQDTGLGMTQQQIDELFQPRLTVSFKGTAGEKGTGLGLVLCKRFVDLNQGEISVQSKEGAGTTFKVSLPTALNAHQTLSFNGVKQAITE
ncbi:HAMP domain-containing sensor histidine kinase [Acinetobacter sp. ANC 5414]|uniref:sensor histidine kinase n=1 Tax=Acinetobacter sp. ANC 5414 TaxID=2731251 RepID=UPI00149065F1|nr:HAMP domain-containing sensor histidine kinase [Acinetobacter sp. ANC 5414]NNH00132.1 HAMP domain-containing histidine kinase [Acinetobacter sp. ANC 5414]